MVKSQFLNFPFLFIYIFQLNPVSGQSGGWFLRVAVEPELELCGSYKFYCPSRGECVPREYRCNPPSQQDNRCPYQRQCYPVNMNPSMNTSLMELEEMENGFFIYRAYSSIFESGSSGGRRMNDEEGKMRRFMSRRRNKRNMKEAWSTVVNHPWKHSFVQYRGFVYEFGKYGVQELDINDPKYKYNREWTEGWEIMGVSKCKRSDVLRFMESWNYVKSDYLWYANNCHHFSNAFIKYLKSGCLMYVEK